MENEKKKCCICGKNFEGYGNSAWPIDNDANHYCCNECNFNVVLLARIMSRALKDWTNELVKVKPKWLDPGENPETLYIVLEDQGDRVLVGELYPTHPIPRTWCWSKEWCELYGGN